LRKKSGKKVTKKKNLRNAPSKRSGRKKPLRPLQSKVGHG